MRGHFGEQKTERQMQNTKTDLRGGKIAMSVTKI
jgi:hypothetical protein